MEQKRVRNSSACEVCRKRRGKCSGSAPCSYCAEHSLLCVFSATIKKRGPASKKQKGLFNFTEGAFVLHPSPDAEYKYMGEYLNHFFFLPPLNQDGIHNPTTPAHHMTRFVLLSHMARSFGAIARSDEFVSTARQISGQLFDEPSYDSGVAFMLLADICLANGDSKASHYASVAWNHAKVLPRNDWSHIHLQLQSFVMSNMLDASLTPEQKQQQLYSYASQLLDADILTTIISGLMLKTGAVGLILNGKSCKEAGLLNCLKNLTVDCSIMETMNDLDKLEHFVQNTPPIQKWVLMLFAKMFRTMLYIQQGCFTQASEVARSMVEISNRPEMRYIVKNELFLPVIMPNLANMGSLSKVVVELYHFTQQLENGLSSDDMNIPNLKTEEARESMQCCFHNLFSSQSNSHSHSHPHPHPHTHSHPLPHTPSPLPSYSPPNTTPSSQPLTYDSFDPTLQQVPQTDVNQLQSHSPPQQTPVHIAKQPNMQTPTQQPTLQLTLQQLFLQQGLRPQPPLPSLIPTPTPTPSPSTIPTTTTTVPTAPLVTPTHSIPTTPIPVTHIINPTITTTTSTTTSTTAHSIPIPVQTQKTFNPNTFPMNPLPPPFSNFPATSANTLNPEQHMLECTYDEELLWWQNSEKVDEMWNQAIMG